MAAVADAYKVQGELDKLVKAINELRQTVAKLEQRVVALEKPQTTKTK